MIIARPQVALLTKILHGKAILPYQYVNWWLYQNGCDNLMKTSTDYLHPAFHWVVANQKRVVYDLLLWLGEKPQEVSSIDHLLNPMWRVQ